MMLVSFLTTLWLLACLWFHTILLACGAAFSFLFLIERSFAEVKNL